MNGKRTLWLLLALLISGALVACGPSGPKADLDLRVRILTLAEGTPQIVRVSELEAGRHYEFEITPETVITMSKQTITFGDLKKGMQLRVRANKTPDNRFLAVSIDVMDLGEGVPLRR